MAKKTDVTVEEKLRALYDLQLIESRVDEIRNVRGELPLEVEDLEDEVAGLNTRLEKLDADLEVIDNDITAKKNLIEEAKASIKKYTEQQKNVRNNREFNALSKEVEFQELEIELAEKHIREYRAQIEQKKEVIEQTRSRVEERQKHLESGILKALFEAHPYEEVAYEVYSLENSNQEIGMGMIGELEEEAEAEEFLEFVKQRFSTGCIRHSALPGKKIKKVAVLGGSGSFAIDRAKKAGADIFLTADLKYHDFYKAEGSLVLADIGHYESEQFTKNLLHSYLKKNFANFAIVLSNTNTNPIKYF